MALEDYFEGLGTPTKKTQASTKPKTPSPSRKSSALDDYFVSPVAQKSTVDEEVERISNNLKTTPQPQVTKTKKGIFDKEAFDQQAEKLKRGGAAFDAGLLNGIGSIVDFLGGNVLRGVSRGLNKVTGTNIWHADNTQEVRAPYKKLGSDIKSASGITPENQTKFESTMESIGYSVPAIGAGIATGGGSVVGAAVVGGVLEAASEGQQVYDTLKSEGADEKVAQKQARKNFIGNAILNSLLNRLEPIYGGSKLFTASKSGAMTLLKTVVTSNLTEVPQEVAQQIISNITTFKPWNAGLKETAIATIPQATLFGILGLPTIEHTHALKLKDEIDENPDDPANEEKKAAINEADQKIEVFNELQAKQKTTYQDKNDNEVAVDTVAYDGGKYGARGRITNSEGQTITVPFGDFYNSEKEAIEAIKQKVDLIYELRDDLLSSNPADAVNEFIEKTGVSKQEAMKLLGDFEEQTNVIEKKQPEIAEEEIKASINETIGEITQREQKQEATEVENIINTAREEGYSELEVTERISKQYKMPFKKAVEVIKKYPKASQVNEKQEKVEVKKPEATKQEAKKEEPVKKQSKKERREEKENDKKAEQPKFKLSKLTVKTLKKLGDRKTVSKQYISDLTNSGDIKQVERDVIRKALENEGDTVNVADFKEKVESELLPLNSKVYSVDPNNRRQDFMSLPKYENIVLPNKKRGDVANYRENIYESPIRTRAGHTHFSGQSENYFGHTRVEDMADGETRRIIEVQTDLYQKGNIENEQLQRGDMSIADEKSYATEEEIKQWEFFSKKNMENGLSVEEKNSWDELSKELFDRAKKDRGIKLSKLQQYNDPTAHFRMVREEIQKAAEDGMTKVQFPTGETAMEIEGLGQAEDAWVIPNPDESANENWLPLKPEMLEVGQEVTDKNYDNWVITKVLEDGKFEAVTKDFYEQLNKGKRINQVKPNGMWVAETAYGVKEAFDTKEEAHDWLFSHASETFDISGKVDANNPIYKFYEKELGRYLKNRYDTKIVEDKNGASWYEVSITPEMKEDVEAFKIGDFSDVVFDRKIQEVQSKLDKIFGRHVPIEVVFNAEEQLTDGNALGAVIDRTVKLLEENGSLSDVVASHEGWHWFKQNLSFKDRQIVNQIEMELFKKNPEKVAKLQKDYEKYNPTDEYIAEELMADEFAYYHRTGKTFIDKMQLFFERLLQQLDLIFSHRTDVLRLFRNVDVALRETAGNTQKFDPRSRMKLNRKFPEFNTGDKANDVRLALEAAERRVDIRSAKPRTTKLYGRDIALSEELENEAMALDIEAESLEENPLNMLWKYANKREGTLPEVTGKDSSKFARIGDDILSREEFARFADPATGMVDTELVREKFSDFFEHKKDYAKRFKNYRERVSEYVEEKKKTDSVKKEREIEQLRVDRLLKERAEKQAEREKMIASTKEAIAEGQRRAEKAADSEMNKKIALETPVQELGFWKRMIGQTLNPLKYTDKSTQNIFNNWHKKIVASRIRANKEVEEFIDIPRKENLDTIFDYEVGKPTKYTNAIKKKFDALFAEARARGVDTGFRENYLPHVYREDAKQIEQKITQYFKDKGMTDKEITAYTNGQKLSKEMSIALKLTPFFSKERVFPSYKVALQYGLTPKYTNVAQLVGHYIEELEKTVANNEIIKELSDAGKIVQFEDAPLTWDPISLPFQQKGYMAAPNTAKAINGLFGKMEKTAWTYLSKISKRMQEIKLSAGLPFTTVNFFAIGQTIKELTSGNVKVLNAFFRANFNRASVEWFKKNRPYMYMMSKQGIDLGSTVDSWENLYGNLYETKGFAGKAAEVFDRMFNKTTFMSFLPMMHIQVFKDSYNAFINKGYPPEIAEELAGRVTAKNFGLSSFTGRSKATQDKLSAVFFAPKFREGIINTLYNTGVAGVDFAKNLGGLRSPLNPTLVKNRKLLAGMIITYFLYNLLNKALNDGDDMWDNPPNRKFALQIPSDDGTLTYVEFMPSFLAFARNMASGVINLASGDISGAEQKFGSVFSMPIKTTTEILANADYFGRPIYKETDTGGQKALKIAKYLGLAVNHPYVTEVVNQIQDKKPLYQSVITGLEIPLKFSDEDAVAKSAYYDALDKKAKENARAKEKVQPKFDEIQSLKEAGDIKGASEMYKNLTEDEKLIYASIMRSPTTGGKVKDFAYSQALEKWDSETKSQSSLDKIEVEIAESIYGPEYTPNQLNVATKQFAFMRTFGADNEWANTINDANSNAEKLQALNDAREALGLEEFKKLFNTGRKTVKYKKGTGYILISDQLKDMYFKQNK